MNIFVDDNDIKELLIEDIVKSEDNGKIIIPTVGERREGLDEITKEIIAHDAIALGPSLAARIHNIGEPSASKYKDGKDIKDEDVKTRVLASKHNIADMATAKLMESLNLFDPTCIDKETDRIKAATGLATIIEKMSDSGKNAGNKIELHMYAPKQRPMREFEIIEVS